MNQASLKPSSRLVSSEMLADQILRGVASASLEAYRLAAVNAALAGTGRLGEMQVSLARTFVRLNSSRLISGDVCSALIANPAFGSDGLAKHLGFCNSAIERLLGFWELNLNLFDPNAKVGKRDRWLGDLQSFLYHRKDLPGLCARCMAIREW
jgi:hypothetical protein